MDNEKLIKAVDSYEDYMIKTRRYLHENPELSGQEINTSKFLKEEVRKLGLPITEVEGTGFYAILDTGRPGKTLGLRTDIDALPIKEADRNSSQERIVKSKNEGVFHACGHDGHMTIALTTMKILVENKDDINGKVIFIFEEGEETNVGIKPMIEALKGLDIDAFYGNHLASFLETGKIGIDKGPIMAGFGMVDFTIVGQGGHGSRPDLSVSPIFAASQVVNALASAWVNRIDVGKTVTLGLGSINGGSIANVIPDEVNIKGTLRFFDEDEGKKALEIIKKVGSHIAAAHDCEFVINQIEMTNEPVVNDEYLAELANKSIGDVLPEAPNEDIKWYASETFSSYSKLAPTMFTLVGSKNEEKGTCAEHHNQYYDLDEDSLAIGVKAMTKFTLEYLKHQ